MRGALDKVPGVTGAEIEAGKTDIVVSYDSSVTDTDKILAGLKAGGESARKKWGACLFTRD